MATNTEDVKVLEKVASMAKRELDPAEYARFLTLITPKAGDSTKEFLKIKKDFYDYVISVPEKFKNQVDFDEKMGIGHISNRSRKWI